MRRRFDEERRRQQDRIVRTPPPPSPRRLYRVPAGTVCASYTSFVAKHFSESWNGKRSVARTAINRITGSFYRPLRTTAPPPCPSLSLSVVPSVTYFVVEYVLVCFVFSSCYFLRMFSFFVGRTRWADRFKKPTSQSIHKHEINQPWTQAPAGQSLKSFLIGKVNLSTCQRTNQANRSTNQVRNRRFLPLL